MRLNIPGVPAWISKMDETVTVLAAHYRRRAEEIRHFARSQAGSTREKLVQLADGYESAAEFHEQTNLRFRSLGADVETAP